MSTRAATEPAPQTPRRRRRRWPWVLAGVGLLLVVLVIAYFVVDASLRSYAEKRLSSEITSNLPSSVSGEVQVTIGGGSVIGQYLAGSFSDVRLDAPALEVDGSPVNVTVTGNGIPTDLSKPVQHVHGTITVDQAALNAFVSIPGATGDITLGSGTATYEGMTKLLGIPVTYEVTVKPEADGGTVLLQPTSVTAKSGFLGVDLTNSLQALFGTNPVPVCVAGYLPDGVSVTDIHVEPNSAKVTFDASSLVLSQESLQTKGSCG